MILYTKDGSYPNPKPHRIRLPDGNTRTADAITHQMMLDAGYTVAPDYPTPNDSSNTVNWPVYDWNANTSSWTLKY